MTGEMPGVFDAADKLLACFFQSATIMPCERAENAMRLSLVYRKNS